MMLGGKELNIGSRPYLNLNIVEIFLVFSKVGQIFEITN